jgi:hypothetical protein
MVVGKVEEFEGINLTGTDFSNKNLDGWKFIHCDLTNCNFSNSQLRYCDFSGSIISYANFKNSDFSFVTCEFAPIHRTDFTGALIEGTSLTKSICTEVDFSNAVFDNCDLSGWTVIQCKFTNSKGLGSKKSEQAFAKSLLKTLSNPKNKLKSDRWHTCSTTHCIAGWAYPHEKYPAAMASMAYPTLSYYFYLGNDAEVLEGLKRVAAGTESIWNWSAKK